MVQVPIFVSMLSCVLSSVLGGISNIQKKNSLLEGGRRRKGVREKSKRGEDKNAFLISLSHLSVSAEI